MTEPFRERAVAETARVLKSRGRVLVDHFTPEVDLAGEGVRRVAGEPGVYEGLAVRHTAVPATP
jgi:hypothetical protein